MKIIFFGSSDYCLPVLETLNKSFRLVVVISRPDKPVGRKQILTPSFPKKFALSHNMKIHAPKDKMELLRLKEEISQLQPDLAIVSDYGLIIPKKIFEIPHYKTLNIHFSKLPQFRGPSPIQYTILTGQKSAWISIIVMDEGVDTGDIIWQKEVKLFHLGSPDVRRDGVARQRPRLLPGEKDEAKNPYDTTKSLYKKLFKIAASELPNVISLYTKKKLKPRKQNHSKATYTRLFTREDGFIPPKLLSSIILSPSIGGRRIPREALKSVGILHPDLIGVQDDNWVVLIERAIRAFTPWPGVWTEIDLRHLGGGKAKKQKTPQGCAKGRTVWCIPKYSPGVEESEKCRKKRLKILKAHLEPTTELVLDLVQLEGKKPVSWKQFQQGYLDFSF